MATSGEYVLDLTLNDIVEAAVEELQVSGDGETLDADMLKRGRNRINRLLKSWEAQGLHLWTIKTGTLFLQPGQAQYSVNGSNVANTYYTTTLSGAEAAGETILSVPSTANMVIGSSIGVMMENRQLHWSTITGFALDATVSISIMLPQAALSGAKVYYYDADSFQPIARVTEVRREEEDGHEIPIVFESRSDYKRLPNKTALGVPIQAYYDRQEPQGIFSFWPTALDSLPKINFDYERKIQIMNLGTQTFDLPEYFYDALVFNLARRLISVYGCSVERADFIKGEASDTLALAMSFDTELYPIRFEMEQR